MEEINAYPCTLFASGFRLKHARTAFESGIHGPFGNNVLNFQDYVKAYFFKIKVILLRLLCDIMEKVVVVNLHTCMFSLFTNFIILLAEAPVFFRVARVCVCS